MKYFLLLFIFTSTLFAKEFRYLNRSPRALLMGDAFTSLASDDYTLFYNPAGLARTTGIAFKFVNFDLGFSDYYHDQEKFENIPSDVTGISNRFLGYPIYVHAGTTPTIKMMGFGFSLMANNTTTLVLRNAITPLIDIDYRYDRGFVMGYAYTLGTFAKAKKESTGSGTSIGMSVKHINREGLKGTYHLFGTNLISKINTAESGNMSSILESLGYTKGDGWGVDTGFLQTFKTGISETALGFSILDVGDTQFRKTSGTGTIPRQDMSVNFGASFKQDYKIFDYAFSCDIHPINDPMELQRKLHFGFQFGLPLVRAFAGMNAGYVSYGLQFRFWPISILAGFYSAEIGADFKQEEAKRAILYVSLFDFSFDL
jgi:hypothetical protein